MAKIDFIYNCGFLWHSERDCHVKGFAHTPGGKYLKAAELATYFAASSGFEDFTERVAAANGMFSVVMLSGDKVWMATDRMRTFPLFYTSPDLGEHSPEGSAGQNTPLRISDSVDHLIKLHGGRELNPHASAEFLAAGYVTGKDTIAEGIFQLQAGETIEIDLTSGPMTAGEISRPFFYSSYRTSKTREEPAAKLIKELAGISERISGRLADSLEGRAAVIALSGGFDSRWVAAMLKKAEYPEVFCFSYGRKGNPDMLRAEEVAGILGFRFIPVVYTDRMIEGFMEEEDFLDYVRFSSNHVSMFFMQEYFALKYLRENRLVPDDSVFIPGHSGDFFGGSQLIRHGLHPGGEDIQKTVRRVFDVKYAWLKPAGETKKRILDRIEQNIREKGDDLPYSIHEDWDLKEKLAKFIVNSCNIYAWFGYEYRLPLYDYELQDFFRDVPFELKAGKKLYDDFLKNHVFADYGLNFPAELQPDEKTQKKARLKGKIKSSIPTALRPVTVSQKDPIFYYEITRALQQDLEKKGIRIKIRGNSYNSLIVQWYIEHLKTKM